uniref:hypothetical protein n=1 Tax=Ndongobacter massiliensis TaxID=1871025 RepID=UPI0009308405|nr:hypothetical protein [Ndongobacter massiliensis]
MRDSIDKKLTHASRYDMKGVKRLAGAIVEQAVKDYGDAFMGDELSPPTGQAPEQVLRENENFFRSEWYRKLVDIDGEWLMRKVKIKKMNEAIDVYKKVLEKPTAEIRLIIPKSKEEPRVVYKIPHRLFPDFAELLRKQIKELEKEKEVIEEGA